MVPAQRDNIGGNVAERQLSGPRSDVNDPASARHARSLPPNLSNRENDGGKRAETERAPMIGEVVWLAVGGELVEAAQAAALEVVR